MSAPNENDRPGKDGQENNTSSNHDCSLKKFKHKGFTFGESNRPLCLAAIAALLYFVLSPRLHDRLVWFLLEQGAEGYALACALQNFSRYKLNKEAQAFELVSDLTTRPPATDKSELYFQIYTVAETRRFIVDRLTGYVPRELLERASHAASMVLHEHWSIDLPRDSQQRGYNEAG